MRGSGGRHGRRRALGAVAVLGAAAMVAACGSSSNSSNKGSSTTAAKGSSSTIATPAGTPVKGGTVVVAESPGTAPNYIFPMAPSQDYSVYNSDMQAMLYRPLYWFGQKGNPAIDLDKSVGQMPTFNAAGTVCTVKLNDFKWSDGETVDARDVVFWMNMLKAEKANWAAYVPGYFPDNVVSTTMPDGPTGNVVQFNLNKKYNETWFLYNELSQVTPLPIAWDKTSASAPAPSASAANLPDTTVAGAKAVYTYLSTAAKDINSFVTSPVWSVIDGPWKLTQWTTQGAITMVPNPSFTGPDKPYLDKFVYTPYTTDTAEYNQLRASKSINVGYIPTQDINQTSAVQAEGYNTGDFYAWGVFYTTLNYTNPTAGPLFKQLYIRQALEDLEDQQGWIKAFFSNVAAPQYGVIPQLPKNNFISPQTETNPYPFSVSAAKALLVAHGWTVKPNGTDTCAVPAKCGAGITAGEPLTLSADVSNGVQSVVNLWQDYKSDAAQAGIQLNVSLAPFTTVYAETTSSSTKWQLAGGDGWTFAPDFYPTGEDLYLTGAVANSGSYSDPTADNLIKATLTDSPAQEPAALNAYQNYLAKQLPVLWNPNAGTIFAVSKNLGGTADTPNALEYLDPESWYYVKS